MGDPNRKNIYITESLDDKTMTLDGTRQLKAGTTASMGAVGTVTQSPENTRRIDNGQPRLQRLQLKANGHQSTKQHTIWVTLPSPMGSVATEMIKIKPETQRKSAR